MKYRQMRRTQFIWSLHNYLDGQIEKFVSDFKSYLRGRPYYDLVDMDPRILHGTVLPPPEKTLVRRTRYVYED